MTRYQYSDVERNLIENSLIPFGVFQRVDGHTVVIALTKGMSDLFGFDSISSAYAAFDEDVHFGCHPDDLQRMQDMYRRLFLEGEVRTIYRKMIHGKYMVFRIHAVLIHKEEGIDLVNAWFANEGPYIEGDDTETYAGSISKAVTERTQLYYFKYDFLTGLPNMSYFFELAEHGREEILNSGDKPCVLYFDLCGMKGFNQKFSFAEGDKLLTECGRMLAKRFGRTNCGRFSGDHFCVFTKVAGLEKELDEIIKEAKDLNEGRSLPIKVGVYRFMDRLVTPSIACDRAKRACDAVRNNYFSCISYFDEKMLKASEEREYVITNLDKALESGWIRVFYQPIIRAANGKVCDEEALARWDDPLHGSITPAVFIPALEDARLIYKLDLFVAGQVINKMKGQAENGDYVSCESINISRTDFDICDIVEELTKLTDEADIDRDKLTIEITESAVGSDIDYMKEQIERFHELGFKVWMDDYGSGYSSPEILQEIHFDTIKLDMQFMKNFDHSDTSKIIMTELVRMACALGIESVAEGVETVEQVEFLKEIGCTKLQGYHYCKPMPIEMLYERYKEKKDLGFENPKESDYYKIIGNISLYDLHMSAGEKDNFKADFFDTLPMSIMEISDRGFWIVRANKPYKEFFTRTFPGNDMYTVADIDVMKKQRGAAFCNALIQCARDGKRVIIDERAADGMVVHILIRRAAVNPVTKVTALVVAILGIKEIGAEELTYTYIAQALSSDYLNLFYVDLDNDNYIEYSAGDNYDDLAIERHGSDFFAYAIERANSEVYEEDKEYVIETFTKENIVKALEKEESFTLSYRIYKNQEPIYVHMKAVRIKMKGNSIIVGISNINAQMKDREVLERIQEENRSYSRLVALSENYISVFVVDPETDHFIKAAGKKGEAITNEEMEEGEDFFNYFIESRKKYVALGDLEYVIEQFKKEKVLEKIKRDGSFNLKYRFVLDGEVKYAVLKATIIDEKGEKQLIVGISDDTDETLRKIQTEQMLIRARNEANVDALTGVKNRNAYLNTAKQIDSMIRDGKVPEFAMVVLDINGLKEVNDSRGHQEGDEYLKRGCGIICTIFRNCPVYRIGGDEFIVIAQGKSYKFIDKIMQVWEKTNLLNLQSNDVALAAGMVRYNGENTIEEVFEKADALMYKNKRMLKARGDI